jgi:hypothetical protein
MVGVFLVAAVVTAVAIPPALMLDRRKRMLGPAGPAGDDPATGRDPVPSGAPEPDARPEPADA